MGIRTSAARLLCELKRETDIDYSSTLMLGRQELCMNKRQIKMLYGDYGDVLSEGNIEEMFCEKLFSSLGGDVINSLDASEFEGATIIHDLNQTIPVEWEESYTCIVDGGTTEHIYDFAQAMRNIMRMLKVGGYYIGMVPSNNWNGHGFYQFSPVLYIQLFCEQNRFELKKIYVSKGWSARHLWELVNWDAANRIEINGRMPSELYIVARKTASTPEKVVLQQKDYELSWSEEKRDSKIKSLAKKLPWELQCFIAYHYRLLQEKKKLKKIKF